MDSPDQTPGEKTPILEAFSYAALDASKQEIRLLRLLPSKDKASKLVGYLFDVPLSHSPRYDALSYTWGNPQPTECIQLSGMELRIPLNLCRALHDLRRQDEDLVIWADGICINQEDRIEAGTQVQLMRRIYSGASTVRAWIDQKVEIDAPVFRHLSKLLPREVNLDSQPPEFWYPAIDIFCNTYWSRLWVQQELILGAEVMLHLQSDSIRASPLLAILHFIDRDGRTAGALLHYLRARDFQQDRPSQYHFLGRNYFELKWLCQQHSPPGDSAASWRSSPRLSTAFELLQETFLLRVTDPRDQIYGMLGLAGDCEPDEFIVDYSLSAQQVYIQALEMFTQKNETVSFLCSTSLYENLAVIEDGTLPFSIETSPSWLPTPGRRSLFHMLWKMEGAAGHIKPLPQTVHHEYLRLRGFKVDQVKFNSEITNLSIVPVQRWLAEFCRLSGKDLMDETDSLFEDYMEAWNMAYFDGQDTKRTLKSWYQFFHNVMDTTQNWDLKVGDAWSDDDAELKFPGAILEEARKIVNYFNFCQFVGLEKSRIGIASSAHLQAGDEVWVVFGCPLLLILRQGNDGRYRFVTQAWIPGLMQGQACVAISSTGEAGDDYSGPPVTHLTLW